MKAVLNKTLCFIFAALFLPFMAPAAQAQDTDARLNRIENEIQTLSRAIFRGETPPPPAYQAPAADRSQQADLSVRLSQIEQELANLTGQIEEQDYRMRQLEQKLEGAVADMNNAARVAPVMPQLGAPKAGMTTMQVTPTGEAPALQTAPMGLTGADVAAIPAPVEQAAGTQTLGVLSGKAASGAETPEALYDQAFSFMKARQYEKADALFNDFITRYPNHSLVNNARYWRGETFYVRGQYEAAARLFAEGYQKDPKGSKGPDNLLKLGVSLAGIGKKEDACLTFDQLAKEYSAAPAPILDRTETERRRLGCQ